MHNYLCRSLFFPELFPWVFHCVLSLKNKMNFFNPPSLLFLKPCGFYIGVNNDRNKEISVRCDGCSCDCCSPTNQRRWWTAHCTNVYSLWMKCYFILRHRTKLNQPTTDMFYSSLLIPIAYTLRSPKFTLTQHLPLFRVANNVKVLSQTQNENKTQRLGFKTNI